METSKNCFPSFLKATALCSGVLSAVLFWLHHRLGCGWLLSCAITTLTVCYHFAMRLCVGALVPNRFHHDTAWFRLRPWEEALYRRMKLRRWKKHIPTYDPRAFSLTENTPEQILSNMRHAEVVHEIIMLLSFVPLLFTFIFGEFFVFFITSALSAAADGIFVCLQRYNRPRIQRLLARSFRT